MIDLHVHTLFSDGQHTPEEVVRHAADCNIKALTITDHDSIGGVERGRAEAERHGIRFISGIEISCEGNRELHILGYNIDCNHTGITSACREFEHFREERAAKIIEYLHKREVFISMEDVFEAAEQIKLIGRPHFALAMVNKGYAKTTREAFDKHLGAPEFDEVERPKPTGLDGIKMILEAGGVPVLAHPALLKLSDMDLERLVKELMSYGLRGMECHYSLHTSIQTKNYVSLAKKYGLLITGGSDFHGKKYKPDIEIGTGVKGSLSFFDDGIIDMLMA